MEHHSIAELLTAGQVPSTEERTHLTEMGRFAAGLFARHLHGTDRPAVNRVDFSHEWATNLSHSLSAATAERWANGMGPMLSDILGHSWGRFDVSGGAGRGYAGLDVSSLLKVIELVDEDAGVGAAPMDDEAAPARRGSLFGPQSARQRAQHQQRQVRRRRGQADVPNVMRLADGSKMSLAVVEALEASGLSVSDSLMPELPSAGELANVSGLVFDRAGQPSRLAGADAPERVSFDGLTVDQRTPALASALRWAESAYGDLDRRFGPSTSRRRMLETVQGVEARQALSAEPEARPVFGFFDSVEGAFLKLTSEAKANAATAQSMATPSVASPGSSLFGGRMAPSRTHVTAAPRVPRTPAMAALSQPASVATSLSRMVSPSIGNMIQPAGDDAFTATALPAPGGAVSSVDARVERAKPVQALLGRSRPPQGSRRGASKASAVTYRRDGRPQARVQRSAVSAPRFETESQSGTAGQWRLAADAGSDLPLGASLTAAEMLAGTVTRRRSETPMTTPLEAFRPLAARTKTPERVTMEAALPGVSWVSMSSPVTNGVFFRGEDVGVPLASQPTGRSASMVPASMALELAAPAQAGVRAGRSSMSPASSAEELAAGVARPGMGPQVTNRMMRGELASGSATGVVTPALLEAVGARFGLLGGDSDELGEVSMLGGSVFDDVSTAAALEGSGVAQRASDMVARFGTRPMARFGAVERTLLVTADERAASTQTDPQGAMPSSASESLFVASQAMRVDGGAGQALEPGTVAAMREGRRALQRPVTTARETLAVERMLTGGNRAEQLAAPSALVEVVRSVEGEFGASAFAAMPALVQTLSARQSSGSLNDINGGGAALTSKLSEAVAELGKLAPARRQEVARQLRLAGFSAPELSMLQLQPARAANGMSAVDTPATVTAGAGAVSDTALGASVTATVTRTARNLARVLTGTEAMASRLVRAATPERPVAGGGQAVAAALSGINTVLETVSSQYFGALAPERVRAASPSLRAAIGDLLTLAKEAAVSVPADERFIAAGGGEFDRPVPAEAQSRIMTQLASLEAMVTNVDAPMFASSDTADASAVVGAPMLGGDAGGPEAGYRQLAGQTAAATTQLVRARLEHRIAGALDASTGGPAGANRLMGELSAPQHSLAATKRSESRLLARAADSQSVTEPLAMAQVLAPEAMLGGMSGAELQAPLTRQSRDGRYAGAAGELTAFNDEPAMGSVDGHGSSLAGPQQPSLSLFSGPEALAAMTPVQRLSQVLAKRGLVDGGSARASRSNLLGAGELVVSAERTDTAIGQRPSAMGSHVADAGGERGAARAATGPLAALLAMVDTSGGRTAEPQALSRLMGRLNRKESIRTGGDSAVREFAVSWMRRVDGTMSGVDVGLGGEATELRRFFGVKDTKQVDSAMSAKSPMRSADLVAPVPSQGRSNADRSGMEGVARAAASAAPGGVERAAKEALSSLNWNYVKTGSGASTTNANLSGLAATAASSGAAGSRVAFPLVAPAVKAVAQTALRSARSESMEPGGGRVEGVHGDAGPGADAEAAPKLTRQALQKLAKTLAGPVSKILKRDQEDRRGKWA